MLTIAKEKTKQIRLVILCLAMITYGYCFTTIHMSLGNGAFIVMNIFPIAAGLFFGMKVGCVIGAMTILLVIFLGSTVYLDFPTFMPTITVSGIVMLSLGAGVGRLRDLSLGIKKELIKRQEVERALRKSQTDLESRVQERTSELEQITIELKKEISERKQAELVQVELQDQLNQAQKMEAIGTMAGGIAHDFNNILTVILGNADMVKHNLPNGNSTKHNIEQVIKAGHRAKDLVKQILTFSRKSEHILQPVEPYAVIKESLNLFRSTTPTTVKIVQHFSENNSTIMADTTQIHQMLMNLFSNAIYAMEEKGTLDVVVGLDDLKVDQLVQPSDFNPGQYLKIEVSDTGIGMDSKIQKRIFDPFYTTKEVGQGTGMGLSIVLRIVKNHNGLVQVTSGPGKGTTFTIFIPVIKETLIEAFEQRVEVYPRGDERILFVDDEETLTEVGKTILERQGYQVTTKSSSTEALEIFRSNPNDFDLVITDQTMPNIAGGELAAILLDIRPDIPIILCTGYSNQISEGRAKEIGIQRYCYKPLDMEDLIQVVRQVLNQNK